MLYCCVCVCGPIFQSITFLSSSRESEGAGAAVPKTDGNHSPNDIASHPKRLEFLLIISYGIFYSVNQAAFLDTVKTAHCECIKQTFDLCS
jgi:hypothetical protein